ncbi:MAG: hypothetical protein EOP62_11680 [Sphingomonadales bacterium]|nr:MAG: hypothetical protein EOP62_11680 [Sphingomonadales bacterium]
MIQMSFLDLLSEGAPAPNERAVQKTAPRLSLVKTAPSPPAAAEPVKLMARSGLPAPHGLGAWGGRRLLYRGDDDLEALTNADLQIVLLDLLVSTARSKADREGNTLDRREGLARAAKVAVMAAEKAALVARTAAAVAKALKALAKAVPPVPVSFSGVAEWLEEQGQGVHRATLYRRPEYANPILIAMGREPRDDAAMEAAADPEYARVARLIKPELIEEIRRGRRALKAAERELADFASTMVH